ncbi:MAG: L-seryl-tRNA(Sec) selenium transferase [Rubripirellula sp.]
MNRTQQLRSLPAVDEVLRSAPVESLLQHHPQPLLAGWARDAIDHCRQQILKDALADEADDATLLTLVVEHVQRLQEIDAGQSIQPVINATGVVLHTNLGRAPLPQRAIERMSAATKYSNVELDLVSGRRSKRGHRVCQLLSQLSGAEDALVVNNCAAATILVLQTICSGKEVIVSRGQLVEIGGGFRLPDVFRSAGVVLREVGTTNRTYLRDYEEAINEDTGAIIRVHRSNFHLSGFVTEPTIDEMVGAKRPDGLPVIDDLGSGAIEDMSHLGLPEPTVPDSVRSGADLTLFSGDKLFGGPQAGIVVGRRHWIEQLRKSPMMRALRADKTTLAALEATAEIHLSGHAFEEIPILKMLSTESDVVKQHCETVQRAIAGTCECEVVSSESQVGGGSIPGTVVDSFAVKIHGKNVDGLARLLRHESPAVQARVNDDCLLLNLLTVPEEDLGSMTTALCHALARWNNDPEEPHA